MSGVRYLAVCRAGDFAGDYGEHETRATAVGKHRLRTGHTVDMTEAPVSD